MVVVHVPTVLEATPGDVLVMGASGVAYCRSPAQVALQGPQGDPGPPGDPGADGADGATGPAGPAPAGNGIVTVTGGALDTPLSFPGGSTNFLREDRTWAAPPAGGFQFPVGFVYISVDSTNPGTIFGYGTWVVFAPGRTLVGIDSGDTDFDTVEETRGAKTVAAVGTNAAEASHTHSVTSNVTVADHASHTHTYTQVPNHVHTLAAGTGSTGNFTQVTTAVDTSSGGTGATPTQTALGTRSGDPVGGVATGTTAGPGAALTHSPTNNAVTSGAGSSHNHAFTGTPTSVVQPSIVVYMFKRTA